MGSKSRSSASSVNTTKDTVVNNVDNRVAEGDASIGGNINVNLSDIFTPTSSHKSKNKNGGLGGSGGNDEGAAGGVSVDISTSDFGALDTASQISDKAFEFAGTTASSLNSTVTQAVDKVGKIAQEATQDESARTQQLLIVGVSLVGIALAYFTFSRRK